MDAPQHTSSLFFGELLFWVGTVLAEIVVWGELYVRRITPGEQLDAAGCRPNGSYIFIE